MKLPYLLIPLGFIALTALVIGVYQASSAPRRISDPDPERTDRGEELSRLSRRYLPLSGSTFRGGEPVVLSPVPTHQFQRYLDDRTR